MKKKVFPRFENSKIVISNIYFKYKTHLFHYSIFLCEKGCEFCTNKSIFKLIEIANENLLYILVSFPFSDHLKCRERRDNEL